MGGCAARRASGEEGGGEVITSLRVRAFRFARGRLGLGVIGLVLLLALYLLDLLAWWSVISGAIAMWIGRHVVDTRLDRIGWAARRAVVEADEIVHDRPEQALALARTALVEGAHGDPFLQAWMVVARAQELTGNLEAADEALTIANKDAARRDADLTLWLRATLQTAFVKAAVGDLPAAEECLRGVEPRHVEDPTTAVEFLKARALLAYRRGEYGRTIDITSERLSAEAVLGRRDRALLEALKQSSLLRLESGGPMRVAAQAPRDAEDEAGDEEEWARAIVQRAARAGRVG